MLSPYAGVLRRPGAPSFVSVGLFARLPMSMIGLGIVLLVSAERGSYGLAGALSATAALSAAVLGPVGSRAVDRWGQSRVGPVLALASSTAMVLFVVAVMGGASSPALFALAAVAGATEPNVGSFVRARWAHLLDASEELRTAFALESVLDEVVFIVGPPLATYLALSVTDTAPLLVAAAVQLVGVCLLALLRRTAPPPSRQAGRGGRAAIRHRGLPLLLVAMVALGGVFGSFEVVTVAFAQDQGVPGATGVLLALYALGSLVAGVVVGAVHPRATLSTQLLRAALLLAVVTLPFPVVPGVAAMAVVATLAGLAVSPVLISSFALVERLVPSARLTEALTWTISGIAVGVSVSSSLAGQLIDRSGPSAGYVVTMASGLLTALVIVLGHRRLAAADAAAVGGPHPPAVPRSVDLVPGPAPGGVRDEPPAR